MKNQNWQERVEPWVRKMQDDVRKRYMRSYTQSETFLHPVDLTVALPQSHKDRIADNTAIAPSAFDEAKALRRDQMLDDAVVKLQEIGGLDIVKTDYDARRITVIENEPGKLAEVLKRDDITTARLEHASETLSASR